MYNTMLGRTWGITCSVGAGQAARHGGRLGSLRGLGGGGLLLHLLETLAQVEHLGVGQRVDLVHRVPGRAARLAVQVVGLHEHGVVAQTPDPDIALPHQVQLDTLADVEPRLVTGLHTCGCRGHVSRVCGRCLPPSCARCSARPGRTCSQRWGPRSRPPPRTCSRPAP